ncbi:hypothetical protein PoB_002141100 [Plakobranchus ocellatus]|uniref:Uncharacterized protein n=1 Tax=Plakobranchus ocellatus TaxID=259542 RepID=A0AAV3ZG66_9GAST|nr:hypothetical protein PoB_002141100 [Plakobranchus ocellatus]
MVRGAAAESCRMGDQNLAQVVHHSYLSATLLTKDDSVAAPCMVHGHTNTQIVPGVAKVVAGVEEEVVVVVVAPAMTIVLMMTARQRQPLISRR